MITIPAPNKKSDASQRLSGTDGVEREENSGLGGSEIFFPHNLDFIFDLKPESETPKLIKELEFGVNRIWAMS